MGKIVRLLKKNFKDWWNNARDNWCLLRSHNIRAVNAPYSWGIEDHQWCLTCDRQLYLQDWYPDLWKYELDQEWRKYEAFYEKVYGTIEKFIF